jgi:hypothetical protein
MSEAGVILGVVLIAAILGGCHLLSRLTWSHRGPVWHVFRQVQIASVVRRAMSNLDQEYRDLPEA